MVLKEFKNIFKFDAEKELYFGIERELYIQRDNVFMPLANEILSSIDDTKFPSTWTHEFSACALEQTIGPAHIDNLHETITDMATSCSMIEKQFNVQLVALEVAPEHLPKEIYPETTGRYQRVLETSPEKLIDAARRTSGIHVHIGLGDHDQALAVHRMLVQPQFVDYLLSIGDHSNRERINLIQHFTEWEFHSFNNWEEFYDHLNSRGLVHDIKSYRPLIRLTRHGTIEFRMFGSTNNLSLIEFYVRTCYNLVKYALDQIK